MFTEYLNLIEFYANTEIERGVNRAFKPLPRAEYEIYRLEKVKSDKYGKVNFDNRKYSVSPEHAQRELFVKAYAFTVWILDEIVTFYSLLIGGITVSEYKRRI